MPPFWRASAPGLDVHRAIGISLLSEHTLLLVSNTRVASPVVSGIADVSIRRYDEFHARAAVSLVLVLAFLAVA